MSRPLQIVVAACLVVLAYFGFLLLGIVGERRLAAESAGIEAAAEDQARCAEVERQLAATKAGRPEPTAEPESVLRLLVWTCRGRPADLLPHQL